MGERKYNLFSETPELIDSKNGEFKLLYDPLCEEDGGMRPGVVFGKTDLQSSSDFGSIYPGMVFRSRGALYKVIQIDFFPINREAYTRLKLKKITRAEFEEIRREKKKSLHQILREIGAMPRPALWE